MRKPLVYLYLTIQLVANHQIGITQQYIGGVLPNIDGKVNYTEVVNCSGLQKDVLYKNAIVWINEYTSNFNSNINFPKNRIVNPINFSSQEDGEINATIKFTSRIGLFDHLFSGKIVFYLKDGRYKYEFSDFMLLVINTGIVAGHMDNMETPIEALDQNYNSKKRTSFNTSVNKLIDSFKSKMVTQKSNDW